MVHGVITGGGWGRVAWVLPVHFIFQLIVNLVVIISK